MSSIFEYEDYKTFLNDAIESPGLRGHGVRTKLAQAAGCQLAFVSQVLRGAAHFSLEQLDGIAMFLRLSAREREFLFVLAQHDRAGTSSLKSFFAGKLEALRKSQMQIRERVDPDTTKILSLEESLTYYSSWHYAAIHVAVGIRQLRDAKSIALFFSLPLDRVSEVIRFLVKCRLLEIRDDKIHLSKQRLHLESGSPLIKQHHANWRARAIQQAELGDDESLQYSSAVTLSEKDALALKTVFLDAIVNAKSLVRQSKDERAYCFNLDFFPLG